MQVQPDEERGRSIRIGFYSGGNRVLQLEEFSSSECYSDRTRSWYPRDKTMEPIEFQENKLMLLNRLSNSETIWRI